MRTGDLIAAAVLLIVAAGYFVASGEINRSALADEVGAAGVPVVYAATLAGLAVALAIKALIAARFGAGTSGDGNFARVRRRLVRAAGMLAIGVAYLAVVAVAGYLLTLVAVVAVVALYQGERLGWRLAGIAAGGGVLFFVFFDRLLGVDMPAGLWLTLLGA